MAQNFILISFELVKAMAWIIEGAMKKGEDVLKEISYLKKIVIKLCECALVFNRIYSFSIQF